jgi:hypothetical protein
MIIRKLNGNVEIIEGRTEKEAYSIDKGSNGKNYCVKETVSSDYLNIPDEGNSKTGKNVLVYNVSIEYTCDHRCECYKESLCYAENGCYNFANNQMKYSENYNYFKNCTEEEFVQSLQLAIDKTGYKLFRYFTCGDIINYSFINCMVKLAENNPSVKFWSYTKKYFLVNTWIDCHPEYQKNVLETGKILPNLTIIFSHWLNQDGTYFPMNNPYDLPTSEFIPYGKEELAEKATFICPCSDPTVNVTCETCEFGCYNLLKGQSQALKEHSTKQTKERDKAIKAAKQSIKK